MDTAKLADDGQRQAVKVVIGGRLDVGTVRCTKQTLDEALNSGAHELIIDLGTCQAIDAAGIELLLDVHRRAIHNGSTVVLNSPSQRLRRNLRLAHADKVLRVDGVDPEDAVDASS